MEKNVLIDMQQNVNSGYLYLHCQHRRHFGPCNSSLCVGGRLSRALENV